MVRKIWGTMTKEYLPHGAESIFDCCCNDLVGQIKYSEKDETEKDNREQPVGEPAQRAS